MRMDSEEDSFLLVNDRAGTEVSPEFVKSSSESQRTSGASPLLSNLVPKRQKGTYCREELMVPRGTIGRTSEITDTLLVNVELLNSEIHSQQLSLSNSLPGLEIQSVEKPEVRTPEAAAEDKSSSENSLLVPLKQKLSYGRDYLFSLRDEVGEGYEGIEIVLAALEPCSHELYELNVENSSKKHRHKPVDRRQRGSKAKSLEVGFDLGTHDREGVVEVGVNLDQDHLSGSPFKEVLQEPEVYEDDSEDEIETFQPRAFAVEGEPDFESGEPQDGWEYLRRVKWEYDRCPKVKVARIDPQKLAVEQTPYMPSIPSVLTCPPHLLPSKEWETDFLADFSNLRMMFSKIISTNKVYKGSLPSIHNQAAWEVFCFGSVTTLPEEESLSSIGDESESVADVNIEELNTELEVTPEEILSVLNTMDLDSDTSISQTGNEPRLVEEEASTSIVNDYKVNAELQIDNTKEREVSLQRTKADMKGSAELKLDSPLNESGRPKPPLLGILMRLEVVHRSALLRYHIGWLERVEGLPEERAQWVFALSAVVDKPLDAQTSAAFRALLRRCASLRATKTQANDEELHRLNLLMTIAGRYFGQSEEVLT